MTETTSIPTPVEDSKQPAEPATGEPATAEPVKIDKPASPVRGAPERLHLRAYRRSP